MDTESLSTLFFSLFILRLCDFLFVNVNVFLQRQN